MTTISDYINSGYLRQALRDAKTREHLTERQIDAIIGTLGDKYQ